MGGLGIKCLVAQMKYDYYASFSAAILFWRNSTSSKFPLLLVLETDNLVRRNAEDSLQACHAVVRSYHENKIRPFVDDAADNSDPEKFLTKPQSLNLPKDLKKMMKTTTPSPTKLQAALTQYSAFNNFRVVWRILGPNDNHRIQVLAKTTKTPGIFLQVIPTEPALCMSNKEIRLALLQYLGLPIHNELEINPFLECVCMKAFAPKTVRCTTIHLHNCKTQRAFSTRHDKLLDVMLEAGRSVNLTPEKEVPVSKPPQLGARDQDLQKKRFDIVLPPLNGYGSRQICMDITVASHTSTNDLAKAKNQALFNLKQAVRSKGQKYAKFLDRDTQVFVALACETTGAIDSAYNKILGGLGTRVNHQAPPQASPSATTFTLYWMQRLSVTLWTQSAQSMIRIANASQRKAGKPTRALPSIFEDDDEEEEDDEDAAEFQ